MLLLNPHRFAPAVAYATWNSDDKAGGVTLSNSDRTAACSTSSNSVVRATVGKSAGKWCWEISIADALASPFPPGIGIMTGGAGLSNYIGSSLAGWGWYGDEVLKYNNGFGSAYGTAWSDAAHIVMCELDMDGGTFRLRKNGTDMGVMVTGLTGTIYPAICGNGSNTRSGTINAGQSAFFHSISSGFEALHA